MAVEQLKAAGHPVVTYDLRDEYDLGGQMFLWEFATAVTGGVMGIDPFDEPNVQESKDYTTPVTQGVSGSHGQTARTGG